jgi:beta-mannanase
MSSPHALGGRVALPFEWNPTRGDQGVGKLTRFYPGNSYVDELGRDVYDYEQQTYPGPRPSSGTRSLSVTG